MSRRGLSAHMKTLVGRFEEALEAEAGRWTDWPAGLVAPTRHVLFGGGKRVRPLVAMLAAEAAGAAPSAAFAWGIAVEMIHNYSLAHDDLPAMDDDLERRGRPTCHVAYGEAHAILAGDALLTEAFGVLARGDWPAERTVRLVALLARAAGGPGMVGGQILDIGGDLKTLEALEGMLRLKTGALIRASAEGGAIAAGADDATVERIARYGADLGLLFQITDDLIDRQQDPTDDGKNVLDLLDLDAAHARRDAVAARTIAVVEPLGAQARSLIELVEIVTYRTH